VGDRHSGIPRPMKELKGFTKMFLNPGGSRQVSVSCDRRAFSYYDVAKHAWTVTPGEFDIYVGNSSEEIKLTGKVAH
jgi:beta-glucosidase